jgi:hypothetical protein
MKSVGNKMKEPQILYNSNKLRAKIRINLIKTSETVRRMREMQGYSGDRYSKKPENSVRDQY